MTEQSIGRATRHSAYDDLILWAHDAEMLLEAFCSTGNLSGGVALAQDYVKAANTVMKLTFDNPLPAGSWKTFNDVYHLILDLLERTNTAAPETILQMTVSLASTRRAIEKRTTAAVSYKVMK